MTTPFSNENGTVLLRLYDYRPQNDQRKLTWNNPKALSKVEPFENSTAWKRCFPSVDDENDAIWKRWRHYNNSTVIIQSGGQTLLSASLLIAMIHNHLTLLKAQLILLRRPFDFSKRERYYKAS